MVMSDLLREYLGTECGVFIDDIIVHTETAERHEVVLREILSILRDNELHLSLKKTKFLRRRVKFQGHICGADGLRPDPDRCKAIAEWPRPGLALCRS